jgi:hypothetical protein
MEGNTKESGVATTWKAWVSMFGMMEEGMKVSTEMIRSMDLEFTLGLMADAMRVTGTKANSTV